MTRQALTVSLLVACGRKCFQLTGFPPCPTRDRPGFETSFQPQSIGTNRRHKLPPSPNTLDALICDLATGRPEYLSALNTKSYKLDWRTTTKVQWRLHSPNALVPPRYREIFISCS